MTRARTLDRLRKAIVVLAGAGCGLPLGAYAYLGLFSRYAGDDYCTAGQLVEKGLIDMQIELYRAWSGRFSFTFVVGLVELLGANVVMLLPALALVAWVVVLGWLIMRVPALSGGWPPALVGSALSLAIVYATLSSTPDLGQSLLWQTGMLTYVLPLILLTLLADVVVSRVHAARAGWMWLVAAGLIALGTSGTSETSAALVTAATASSIVLVLLGGFVAGRGVVVRESDAAPRKVANSRQFAESPAVPSSRQLAASRAVLLLLTAALVGAVLALVILLAAPGNAVRGSGHSPSLGFAIPAALDDTRQFLHDWWRFTPASAAVAFLIPAGVALLDPAPRSSRRLVSALGVTVAACGLVLIVLVLMPSFYALGVPQPGRARVVPQYLIALVTAVLGYVVGVGIRSLRPAMAFTPVVVGGCAVLTLGVIVVGPVRSTQSALATVADARAYASRWDQIDQQLHSARINGGVDVQVPPLTLDGTIRGMDFLSRDTSDWLNVCAARYYGLRSIRAE